MSAEHDRLREDAAAWRRWGPYLSERAWGTVREDYSADGDAWGYFPHDHARSRAYRWNEDGLAGISDDKGRMCFALALWNGRDPILKERLFGLSNPQGNHGEDVKERYFYLDATPTSSWLRMRYTYPQAAFPYDALVAESARRTRHDPEYELADSGVFADERSFDLVIVYAKAEPNDLLIRVTVTNRGREAAPLHLLPTLWFRNTWSWGYDERRPALTGAEIPRPGLPALAAIYAAHPTLGEYTLACEEAGGAAPELLFTENDTNVARLFGGQNATPHVKDAFHAYIVHGDRAAVNPARAGTKAAAYYRLTIPAGGEVTVRLRLSGRPTSEQEPTHAHTAEPPVHHAETLAPKGSSAAPADPFADFDQVLAARQAEADAFYAALLPAETGDERRAIFRQALAGLLWCKQFYHYRVRHWLSGDPAQPPPPPERRRGRNADWQHLSNERVMSMPDSWEYPWYAAWDLAFHCVTLALVDPDFAKDQLDLLTREWYQHPNGQLPAYEWDFDAVNPPVQAWAAWRVYKLEQKHWGRSDRAFLERVFHKLLLSFTWWVNRKDSEGNNVFGGGFLGLDNIGVFDRSAGLPGRGSLEQSDGTSWMGMFCLDMLTIALELACENPVYEAIATKFFEHFLAIAGALNSLGEANIPLWNEEDGFFYDVLHTADGQTTPLRVRSFVGLIPLFAVRTIEPALLARLPEFRRRLEWYLANRPDLARLIAHWEAPGAGERRLLALCHGQRMWRLLRYALDPEEFLSPYGVRSLSRYHAEHPYVLALGDVAHTIRYEPGESQSGLFGGNSNWRGPVWFPLNYLLIEALQRYHHYYGEAFTVECPTGSGRQLSLGAIADALARRLISLFEADGLGRRPADGLVGGPPPDPHGRAALLFYEYFHGDTGAGLGASHQTGWTALVAKLIHQQARR
ncbi:MAG: glucosidase [Chloroflexales bacterium]|nr:glucosidase [Chloroflexales bacterium]